MLSGRRSESVSGAFREVLWFILEPCRKNGDGLERPRPGAEDGECALPMVVVLTLGEITNTGDAYLEFYNKTSVVGFFDDQRA